MLGLCAGFACLGVIFAFYSVSADVAVLRLMMVPNSRSGFCVIFWFSVSRIFGGTFLCFCTPTVPLRIQFFCFFWYCSGVGVVLRGSKLRCAR